MAIYKPTDCSPFNGTFDLSSDLPIVFECKVDTSNSPVTGYSIEIYNSNNEIIFPGINRTTGPIKSNITYLTDLKEYVKNKFPSLASNIRNVNSGLNGTVLEIPVIVNNSDVGSTVGNTVGRNQVGIIRDGTNILTDGQTYTWKITLYQEVKKGDNISATTDNSIFPPNAEKYYDMTVASGTVIGSNEKRIQTALIDSDDKVVDNLVLIDKFVQPIKINNFDETRYDPSSPVTSWSGTVPTAFTMTRSLITGYDSTYGYVYPSTADGNAFTDGQIVPENANGFQIFKNGNDPANLAATDMIEFIYDGGEFNGKMTWKTSVAKPEQSYWEQVYLVNSDPGGVFYPLKGDGYSSFALTGSERIIFNNIQESKVQYGGIYYGSPYNGVFEPYFSSKEISTNNKNPSGTYILPAGTYTFKQTTSVEGFTGEQVLNFSTTRIDGVVSEWVKIRTTTIGILYTSKLNSRESLVYLTGSEFINNAETITLKTDQEVSADFLMWFSKNVDVSFYQVTVVWNRTSDASNWGTLSNKIIYCRRDGKNYEINTTTQVGEINKTPFKFVEEKPVRIFNTTTVTTTGGGERYNFSSNSCIFNIESAISSILSVTNNKGVDITKDCAFEAGKNYIIYTSSSSIPSDLTISVKYIPFNVQDYAGIIFYNKKTTSASDSGRIYIRPSVNINKNMIFKEITTKANPTWFNINYFNKDYNYITYIGNNGFNPGIDKTRYQIKSFYKDSDYNPFSIYKDPVIETQIETADKNKKEIKPDGLVNNVETRNFTVMSNYSQNSYIQWRSYQWILYDSAKRTVLEKTEESYSGEILGKFYGLEPQQYYTLSLILQTNSGKIIEIDYIIYTDFTEVAEQRDLVHAEFDCDTLSMKMNPVSLGAILAPDADQYLSGTTTPTKDTAYYYDSNSDFYKKKNVDGEYESIASIKDGILTISGQNSIGFSKVFDRYDLTNEKTRVGDLQINADEIVVEGSFNFSEDYNGNIFSLSREEEGAGIVQISIPEAIKSKDSDGFVALSDDINKVKIGSNSYLRIIDQNGNASKEWQNSSEFHNTSIWKKGGAVPSGNRVNVANFKYAEVKNDDGTYNKDTYLNIAGPYNSYDTAEPLKNPTNPEEQPFLFFSSDKKDISGMCSDGPFYINQPNRLIWLDYKPHNEQVYVVQNADETTGVTVEKQSVCVKTPLYWDDDAVWKDGTYLKNGTGLSAKIGEVRINGDVVMTDTISNTEDPKYTDTGLVKQKVVQTFIVERKTLSSYGLSFRIFINTNNFTIDQLRSACYVRTIVAPMAKLATPTNVTVDGSEASWDAVENATKYEIIVNNESWGTTGGSKPEYIFERETGSDTISINLKTQFPDKWEALAVGVHSVRVRAKNPGNYLDSDLSMPYNFAKTVPITVTATNCTASTYNPTEFPNLVGEAMLTFNKKTGYTLPQTITVTGVPANGYTWIVNSDGNTATLKITAATGAIEITVNGIVETYAITTNLTHAKLVSGPLTIAYGASATLTFSFDDGYEAPDQSAITVTGASFTWNKVTGVLTLSNATGPVAITIAGASLPKLDTPTNVTVDGTTVSWDEVTDATSYDVYADDTLLGNTTGEQGYADCLTFIGKPDDFTLQVTNKTWDGTLEWSTDHETWTTLTGTEVMESYDNKLYLRGKGNTTFFDNSNGVMWQLNAPADCVGNIQTLIDWENPPASLGGQPDCYHAMFKDCTNLTSAPELPVTTTMTSYCYAEMFSGCTSLTRAPALPATVLEVYCYENMFNGCSGLKVNTTSGAKIFTCPSNIPEGAVDNMFTSTGGTFTGTPTAGTTYYWTE